jgi:parallel beta-helix repeat protein
MKAHTFSFIIFFLVVSHKLHSKTYFVSNTGSNTNTGLSAGTAFLTLQKAASVLIAGDSVLVADGTYAGFDYRGVSGTAGDPIVFKTIGSNVLINSKGPNRNDGINIEGVSGAEIKYIEINGFKIQLATPSNGNGIRLVFADYCIVRNCVSNANFRGIFTGFTDYILIENNVCSNSIGEHGIYVSNSSDFATVRYNDIFGNINIGIHMNGDASQGEDGIIHSPVIYANKIHDNNLAAGINLDGVDGAIIYNNVIYNNHFAQGIVMFQGDGAIVSRAAKIYNNTIVVPSDGRWGVLIHDGGQIGTEVYNNIILNLHSWRGCIGIESTTGFISDYNIVQSKLSTVGDGAAASFASWQANGFDAHSYAISNANIGALFENFGVFNLHLSSTSLAIDKGTSAVSATVTTDFESQVRTAGAYDIGAYESNTLLAIEELSSFFLKQNNGTVQISWQLDNAENIKEVDIEHSTDGFNYYSLTHLNRPHSKKLYTFIHKQPVNGYNYYRLKTFYHDESSSYSDSKHEYIEGEQILLYPNPTNGDVSILNLNDNVRMNIFDQSGKLVKSLGQVKEKINLDLVRGMYLVIIENNGHVYESKLIIEK